VLGYAARFLFCWLRLLSWRAVDRLRRVRITARAALCTARECSILRDDVAPRNAGTSIHRHSRVPYVAHGEMRWGDRCRTTDSGWF
jgi:hypothetical protein